MPLSAIFDALVRSKNLAADDVLVAAMAEAETESLDAIIAAVLARNQPASLTGLIASYHRFDVEQQRIVLASVDQLSGSLRDCCSMNDLEPRLNVIAIITAAKRYRLAYLLSSLLRDHSPRVRKAAATALQSLAETYLTEMALFLADWADSPPDSDALAWKQAELKERIVDRQRLAEAVGAGLESFEKHLHPPVIETAMWFVDELNERFWSILRLAGGHAKRAALEIMQGTLTPRLVPFAIEALAYDEFRSTIVRAISGNMTDAALLEWVRQSWRLYAEPVAKAMRLVKQWPRLVDSFSRVDVWSSEDQRHSARLTAHTCLPNDSKAALLRKLLLHGDAVGRRAAIWGLCELNCAASTMVLRTVLDGGEPELVAVAKRELRRRSAIEERELQKPQPGADNPVVVEMERYWSEFESLSPAEQAERGTAVLGRPEAAQAFAKNKLTSQGVATRIKAMRILTVTGCGPTFEQSLYSMAHDADPVARSAAMTVLGQIRTATSELLLRAALRDPDSRVQANAVEALDQLAATSHEPLVHEKLRDENNRTRANAVKALLKLRVREAAESLCGMLRDGNPEQRRSGLWVVSELRLAPLVARIVELAKNDPDAQVRRRAQKVLEGLDQHDRGADGEFIQEEVLRSAP